MSLTVGQKKIRAREVGYGSHLPVLTRFVEKTTGPILELGMGVWSTPILHLLCEKSKRILVSFDNDWRWYKKNLEWIEDFHQVYVVDSWLQADIDKIHWSIVLIDHRPAKRRRPEALRVKDTADFVIIHDSELGHLECYRYDKIYPHFKYRFDYTGCLPNTTVLSNVIDPIEIWK